MRWNKKPPVKSNKTQTVRSQKRGVGGYSKKTALLEEAITQMNAGKYGRSSAALKELLALDPNNMEARRLFATLHLRLGSLIPAKQAFDSLIDEAFQRQDYWLAESLLREYLTAAQRCVPFLEKLGLIYQEKGDALEAAAEYAKAVDILIEDPDPENPQRASQLYAKIRDLAPASPVAFRLASFFDAQTGELLVRQPIEDSEPIATPTLDPTAATSDGQGHFEPVNEPMPWELPNPHEVTNLSSSPPLSSPPTASYEVSWQEKPSPQEQTAATDTQSSQQAEEKTSDVQDEILVGTHKQDIVTVLPETTITSPSVQAAPGNASSEVVQPDSVGEVPVTQAGTDLIAPRGDEAADQDQWSVSGETREEELIDAPGRARTFVLSDPTKISEPPVDTTVQISDANVTPSLKMEEDFEYRLLAVEPMTVEATELGNTKATLSQSVENDSQEATAENPSDSNDSSTSGPDLGETSRPWLQPGFSWEAMFNRAWKFGNQESGNAISPEQGSPRNDEPVAEAAADHAIQDPPPGSESEDNHEKDQRLALRDTASAGTPIARMPWDQVQESAISIPPAQLDTPIEDTTGLTVAQSDDTPGSENWASTDEESGDETGLPHTTSHEPDSFLIVRDSETAQPPDAPILPDNDRTVPDVGALQSSMPAQIETASQEEDSFSIVRDSEVRQPQDPPLSLEVDRAVVDVEQASLSIEEEPVLMEAEQQGSLPDSFMIDELSMSEAPASGVAEPLSREVPIAEDQTSAQDEIHIKSADSAPRIEDESSPADSQLSAQEDPREPPWQAPQHTHEVISETTTEASSYFRSSSSFPSMRAEPKLFQPEPEVPSTPPVVMETVESPSQKNQAATEAFVEPGAPMREPVAHQEEWQDVGESIRFVKETKAAPIPQISPRVSEPQQTIRPLSAASSTVDVLFESSPDLRRAGTRQRTAETSSDRKVGSILGSIRLAITGFLRTCFSTTRAIVATLIGFIVLSVMVVALAIGAIGLIWLIMEEPPSQTFQSLTTTPQRTLSDSKKNGYLLLLGMDAAAGQDPAQVGYERSSDAKGGKAALTCFGNSVPNSGGRLNASADVMRKWFHGSDPIGQFKSHQGAIKGWGNEHQLTLDRYGQWQKLAFEDWGYGQPVSPPCATVAFAHQLYVAAGFVQSMDQGIDRLETDMEAWRIVLSQARTLPMKMLALQAINDDIAVASGLLVRSDVDGTHLGQVTKLLRPLDQGELSIRWPMQSELVTASKTYEDQLKAAQGEAQAVSTTVASILPLPKQRRLNDYAKYYEASYKATGEGQHSSLPKWKSHIQFPATTFMDYLTNPIENIAGLEPLPPWDQYNGLVVDTDAQLRLASLQAWLRRGPADGDLLARLAKAGQGFYDPYTGLPMLVNLKKGVFYSVGHDGKDQDGDPELDVVAEIPVGYAAAITKSATGSSRANKSTDFRQSP